jgi:GTP-binding protein
MEKKMKTRSTVVSLIGRPNVGKSTIFNRLLRQNFKAMTFDQPGVTRDRHYDICTLENREGNDYKDLILVDTGGFYPEKIDFDKKTQKAPAEPFFDIMADHAKLAIEESDLILFVVDVREGLIPFDKSILDYIRTTQKPCWLLINKFDTDKQWGTESDFYTLGFSEDDFHILSAEHNRGLVKLKECLYEFAEETEKRLQKENETTEIQKGIKPNFDVVGSLAIIGSPNAGKSTLLNRLIGSKRALVSDVAGTTVDPN